MQVIPHCLVQVGGFVDDVATGHSPLLCQHILEGDSPYLHPEIFSSVAASVLCGGPYFYQEFIICEINSFYAVIILYKRVSLVCTRVLKVGNHVLTNLESYLVETRYDFFFFFFPFFFSWRNIILYFPNYNPPDVFISSAVEKVTYLKDL